MPASVSIESDQFLRLNESANIEIPCLFKGYPLPDVEWQSNTGQNLNTIKNESVLILVFSSLKRKDTGSYSCAIINDTMNASATVEIIVQSKLTILNKMHAY